MLISLESVTVLVNFTFVWEEGNKSNNAPFEGSFFEGEQAIKNMAVNKKALTPHLKKINIWPKSKMKQCSKLALL